MHTFGLDPHAALRLHALEHAQLVAAADVSLRDTDGRLPAPVALLPIPSAVPACC